MDGDLVYVDMIKIMDPAIGCVYYNKRNQILLVRSDLVFIELANENDSVKMFSHFTRQSISHRGKHIRDTNFNRYNRDVSLCMTTRQLKAFNHFASKTKHHGAFPNNEDVDCSNEDDEKKGSTTNKNKSTTNSTRMTKKKKYRYTKRDEEDEDEDEDEDEEEDEDDEYNDEYDDYDYDDDDDDVDDNDYNEVVYHGNKTSPDRIDLASVILSARHNLFSIVRQTVDVPSSAKSSSSSTLSSYTICLLEKPRLLAHFTKTGTTSTLDVLHNLRLSKIPEGGDDKISTCIKRLRKIMSTITRQRKKNDSR